MSKGILVFGSETQGTVREAGADDILMDSDITMTGAETVDGRDLSVDGSKLDGVAIGADVTGSNPPQAHAASHQNGGGDEISVAGLSGELADNQPPKTHAASHTDASDDIQSATNAQKGVATAAQITALENAVDANQGSFIEPFDATVASDGATITLSLEKQGGGNLEMQFSDGMSTLVCAPATLALTAGTAVSPKANYVYVLQSGKVLVKDGTQWPAAEHIKVAYVVCQTAAIVAADTGPLVNQNWNDERVGSDGLGHMLHVARHIRSSGAVWFSGCAGAGGDDYTTSGAGTVTVQVGSGVVYQLHPHTYVAQDTSAGDNVHVVNAEAALGAYYSTSNLYNIDNDSQGVALANKYFNIVLWGVANKGGEYSPLMVNLPDGSYNTLADAQTDPSGFNVFSMPRQFNKESATGFLIALLTFRKVGGTWAYQSTVDLRGITPSTASGGAAGGTTTQYSDALFQVFLNTDNTAIIDFDASLVATGNSRTIQMPNKDVLLDDAADERDPTAHAAEHTNATDDIQDATAGQKGLATAAQITKLDSITSGDVAIGNGASDVTVTGLGLGSAPSVILLTVHKPGSADYNLWASSDISTWTTDGFTAHISATTDKAGYTLSYVIFL